MKRLTILTVMIVAFVFGCGMNLSAQANKDARKAHETITKYTKKELEEKVSKEAKKEAKTLKKAGWLVSPGALPIEKQLERSYTMQFEYNDNQSPKYHMAEGVQVGTSYDVAKSSALSTARLLIIEMIQSELAATVDQDLANEQLSIEDAVSLNKTITTSKSLIGKKLGKVIIVTELYREKKETKSVEVMIRGAVESNTALEEAKNVILEELKKKEQ